METEKSGRLHASRTNLTDTFPERQTVYTETSKDQEEQKAGTSAKITKPYRVRPVRTDPQARGIVKEKRKANRDARKQASERNITIPITVKIEPGESSVETRDRDPQQRNRRELPKRTNEPKRFTENTERNPSDQKTYRTEIEIPVQKKSVENKDGTEKEKIYPTTNPENVNREESTIYVPKREDDVPKKKGGFKNLTSSSNSGPENIEHRQQKPVSGINRNQDQKHSATESRNQEFEPIDNDEQEDTIRRYEHQERRTEPQENANAFDSDDQVRYPQSTEQNQKDAKIGRAKPMPRTQSLDYNSDCRQQ